MGKINALLVWIGMALAIGVPLTFAATSEYLAWRDPVYITAGLSGVVALCVAFVQPLLAGSWLPGLNVVLGRRIHRPVGLLLVATVVIHVVGLWITSPPDVVDALLLRSPTPFSIWGVAAMWALFAAALLSAFKGRISPATWRVGHEALVFIVVIGGSAHAMLVEGTMEPISKAVLCGLTIAATVAAFAGPWLRGWRRFRQRL